MLISDYIQEYAQTVRVPAAEFTPARADQAFRELEERGLQAMRDDGVPPEAIRMTRFVDMCYVGQSFELVVPFGPAFVEAFHHHHEQRYGYEDSTRPTQVVNIRVRVVGPSGAVYRSVSEPEQDGDARTAQVDTIAMYSEGQWQEAPVYDRQRLQPGNRLYGPALIAEYSATTVVPADFTARVDGHRNVILRAHRTP
jgi:N-methylhydantoinase A